MISLARLDRGIRRGAEVRVRWGGFSDEPVALIRAKVVRAAVHQARNREKVLALS